uniref:Retrovirus-related Pol polyprotein from transposon TNT 1-94-like beta-barrel domain-containing protein n=1 Tax=Tanacetum cinerariifolium TaxID=118510 RepID=A0A699HCY4_TANCI|nr:hypothetical protein [Tanacetum cinerariifolium]
METRDSDDALVCCVKNTVEDRIMDSVASLHATYCKEELERFKLRSGKVRLADDKTLDIVSIEGCCPQNLFWYKLGFEGCRYIPGLKRRLISVGQLDEDGFHVHPEGIGVIIDGSGRAALYHQRLGDMSMIDMNMLASKGNVPDVRKVDIYFCKPGGFGKQNKLSFIMSAKTRKLQRNYARYNANLLKIVSKIPLQFGVAERLSQTFRAESTRLRAEVPKMLSADSVGDQIRVRGLKTVGASRIVDDQMKNTLKTNYPPRWEALRLHRYKDPPESPGLHKESVQWKKAINEEMVSLEKNQTCSLVRLPAGKKAS